MRTHKTKKSRKIGRKKKGEKGGHGKKKEKRKGLLKRGG